MWYSVLHKEIRVKFRGNNNNNNNNNNRSNGGNNNSSNGNFNSNKTQKII